MNTQNLSRKSREELNGSLLDLYRKLTINKGLVPDKEKSDQNAESVPEKSETQKMSQEDEEISPAVGIGI